MQLMSIGKFAKEVGLSTKTLRRMHETGELIPRKVTKGGTRYYSSDQIPAFLNGKIPPHGKVVGYCRVPGPGQESALEEQAALLRSYMASKGYQFTIIKDVGPPGGEKNRGLEELMELICQKEVSRIVVLRQDRLERPDTGSITLMCRLSGIEIEVIEEADGSEDDQYP